jgi:hypothetical protein
MNISSHLHYVAVYFFFIFTKIREKTDKYQYSAPLCCVRDIHSNAKSYKYLVLYVIPFNIRDVEDCFK